MNPVSHYPLVRFLALWLTIIILLTGVLPGLRPSIALAQTSLSVTPRSALAGGTVQLRGSGYTPGNYTGTILWDGVETETFAIPDGGAFAVDFTIPAEATDGPHTITVCSLNPCATGEFAQTADVEVFVGAILLDLTVSLEWEPGGKDSLQNVLLPTDCTPAPDSTYLNDLQLGLENTAAYLYAYTRGQVTLGQIDIYTGGEQWENADIRILANSSYRPSAFIGGIVDEPVIAETVAGRPVLYYPAPVLLGRLWDGNGARCGAWSDPAGWRTIGHELGHFALYLYDQYFNLETLQPQYCTSTDFPRADDTPTDVFRELGKTLGSGRDTLMTYQYTADELFDRERAPGEPLPVACQGTPQGYAYGGLSEWETIKRFYPSLSTRSRIRLSDLDDVKALMRTNAVFPTINLPIPDHGDTTAAIQLATDGVPNTDKLVGEGFLVELTDNNEPARIIGQGWLVPGEANPPPFWGVVPERRNYAAIFVYDETNGRRFATPSTTSADLLDPTETTPQELTATQSQWRPSITITPDVLEDGTFSNVTALQVTLEDCSATTQEVAFAYCPAGGSCSGLVSATAAGSTFAHTFTFFQEPPALHGYIYAREMKTGEEAIVWYQLGGGGGSGRTGAHAPLSDGLVNMEVPPATPGPARDSRVLFSPTPACSAEAAYTSTTRAPAAPAQVALPADVQGIIGIPYNIQPVIAGANVGVGWGLNPADPPLHVRLNYNQDLLDRLGISEDQLVIIRLDGQGVWQVVPTAGQSTLLDWIAATPQPFAGDGALYALAYRGFGPQLFLPLVLR